METAEITGITRSDAITPVNVAFPDAFPRRLHIAVGACKVIVRPSGQGTAGSWVSGTYHGHIEARPLQISQEGGVVTISQRQEWDEILRLLDGVPTLELALGTEMPYELVIDTGANESYLDLGSLPLTNLAIRQGAGKVALDFSAPNPVEMDKLSISSGASSIEVRNLANTNASHLSIEGGAASYNLDFGGTLRQALDVKVSAAISSVDLIIPTSVPARITYQPIMGGVDIGNGYLKKEGAFWTEAAVANLLPLLNIHVTLTMGSLNLHTR
jgi:hypothetical protein